MQTQTDKGTDKGKPQYVRSVRFTEAQWDAVAARAHALKVQVGTFIRNAALAAAGGPTDAEEMRAMADALDSLPKAEAPGLRELVKAAAPAPAKAATAKKSAKKAK